MPYLSFFIAGHDLILDSLTGAPTVVSIWDLVQPMAIRNEDQVPDDTEPEALKESKFILPSSTALACWWQQAGDKEKRFEQYLNIIAPDGRETRLTPSAIFQFSEAPLHRVFHKLSPIYGRLYGLYQFSLMFREVDNEEWECAGRFPFFAIETIEENLETDEEQEEIPKL